MTTQEQLVEGTIEEPELKRARLEHRCEIEAPSINSCKASVDTLAMPPPSALPSRIIELRRRQQQQQQQQQSEGTLSSSDADTEVAALPSQDVAGIVGPMPFTQPVCDRTGGVLSTPLVRTGDREFGSVPTVASDAAQEPTTGIATQSHGSESEETERNAGEIPEGFFDDPEEDARARGIELPSVRARRELEVGLKRFEQEIAVETELAEETRQELDEGRHEDAANDEDAFQKSLQDRLEAFRQQTAAKLKYLEQTKKVPSEDTVDSLNASDENFSDSDVEFDWRAKNFI